MLQWSSFPCADGCVGKLLWGAPAIPHPVLVHWDHGLVHLLGRRKLVSGQLKISLHLLMSDKVWKFTVLHWIPRLPGSTLKKQQGKAFHRLRWCTPAFPGTALISCVLSSQSASERRCTVPVTAALPGTPPRASSGGHRAGSALLGSLPPGALGRAFSQAANPNQYTQQQSSVSGSLWNDSKKANYRQKTTWGTVERELLGVELSFSHKVPSSFPCDLHQYF